MITRRINYSSKIILQKVSGILENVIWIRGKCKEKKKQKTHSSKDLEDRLTQIILFLLAQRLHRLFAKQTRKCFVSLKAFKKKMFYCMFVIYPELFCYLLIAGDRTEISEEGECSHWVPPGAHEPEPTLVLCSEWEGRAMVQLQQGGTYKETSRTLERVTNTSIAKEQR